MTERELRLFEIAVAQKRGEYDQLRRQEEELINDIEGDKQMIDISSKVIVLLQKASEIARVQMKSSIERLVTQALQVVFGGEIKFIVELGARAGSPSAEFLVDDNGLVCNPLDAKGGGLVDVISTALRLAILELYQPKIGGPVLLDEPGKMVSAEYAENFAYFLREYCHRVGRQIIMVTHNAALAAAGDRTFKVRIEDGISEVVQV